MPTTAKKCTAGHSMTKPNTQHHRRHGVVVEECRECVRLAAKKRNVYGYTRGEQVELSKHEVQVEDTSNIKACPKCTGRLVHGNGSHYEDAISCFHCGWRPSARVGQERNGR